MHRISFLHGRSEYRGYLEEYVSGESELVPGTAVHSCPTRAFRDIFAASSLASAIFLVDMATLNGIAQHAQEHQALLTQIGELDYAPSALEQASERLKTIQAELPPRKAKLAEVQKATKKEYDEWQQVLNSRFKRASLKIKGKDHLESRVEKEEREWMEAMREVN